MLHQFTSLDQLDTRKLMDLYAEGNADNADAFYADLPDRAQAIAKAEEDFLDFLKAGFFTAPGRTYWVLEESGVFVSALRLTELEGRLFYLEALETHPDYRRQGCAAKLLREVMEALKPGGAFRIRDCVNKKNVPSLETHRACGFTVAGPGLDCRSGETNEHEYGMEYAYDPE